jgi:hypothetical protein
VPASATVSIAPASAAVPTCGATTAGGPVPIGAVKAGGGGGPSGNLGWGLGVLTAATGAGVTLILARRRRDNV